MAAISQKVPNLLGGVSQQPDPLKLPGQVREANNVYLDPTFGCRKRPGTKFVGQLATDVPEGAKWFPIFRDNNERYIVAMYANPTFTVRVWDLNDASERNVVVDSRSTAYFSTTSDGFDVNNLSIADYTLLSSTAQTVAMGTAVSPAKVAEAIVTIDQVSYNTAYSIDLHDPSINTPSLVYRAKKLKVYPRQYIESDEGICSDTGAEDYQVDDGAKTSLSFRIRNQCSSFLRDGNQIDEVQVTNTQPALGEFAKEYKVTRDDLAGTSSWPSEYLTLTVVQHVGVDLDDPYYSATSTSGGVNYGAKSFITEYRGKAGNNNGGTFSDPEGDGWSFSRGGFSGSEYFSRNTVNILLKNGGEGWRINDKVSVSMFGQVYFVEVEEEIATSLYASDGSVTFVTPTTSDEGGLSVEQIASGLVVKINALSNYTAETVGSTIRIRKTSGDFDISTRGGSAGKGLTAFKGTVRNVSQLPDDCWHDTVLQVSNAEDTEADNYYVKFEVDSGTGQGTGAWVESIGPGVPLGFDLGTMPQALVREANGDFSLKPLDGTAAFGGWSNREVGDEDTNPEPSFIGRAISSMFFFANRLGFLSEDALIMSQPGDYFNFFNVSSLTTSDADPIDLTASSSQPAFLKAAVGQESGLVLFAERVQFSMKSSDVAFAASTVKLEEMSNHFYRSPVRPIQTGSSIIFLSESQTHTKVMEMIAASGENRSLAADITRICPEYVSGGLTFAEVSPNTDTVVMGDGSNEVFIFKYYNQAGERQLAGWAKWLFPENVPSIAFEDDTAYVVSTNGAGRVTLSTLQLVDSTEGSEIDAGFSSFHPRLDNYIPRSDLNVVDNGDGTYTVDLATGQEIPTGTATLLYIAGGSEFSYTRPTVTSGQITVDSPDDFVLGYDYESSVTLPTFFVKQDNRADRVFIPIVEFLYLDLYYSGRYVIDIEKVGYDTYTHETGALDANSYNADSVPLREISTQNIPMFAPGDQITVTIKALDPFPASITSYSWQGHYNNRGISPLN